MRPKLSFANVIALLALFVSLGGTVYAAATIDGRTIRKNSIPADRLQQNRVDGAQVNEVALGTVPSAATAAEAAQAPSAGRANSAARAQAATRANTAREAERTARAAEADLAKAADRATVADDAAALAGKPASAYLSDCGPGAIKGFVLVDPRLPQPLIRGFNCAGPAPEIIAAGNGTHDIRFPGLTTAQMALASSFGLNTGASAERDPGGNPEVFRVATSTTFNPRPLPDEAFSLVVF